MIDILLIYTLTFAIKLAAYLYSGYAAVLADALHSIVDITMILILIFSERVAKKSADLHHPFGHEMAKNVASLIAGVGFIAFLSFELAKEGVIRIMHPARHANTEIAVFAEVLVLLLLVIAALISSRRSGILNRTLLVESVNDSLSTVAAIGGIALVWSGYPVFDGIATLIIAVIIFYNSFRLVRDNARILLGMSPSDEFYESIEKICTGIDGVEGVHDMVGIYTGENSVHLDLHATVSGSMTVADADKLSEKIFEEIRKVHPEVRHISVHFCPHSGLRRKIYTEK